MYKKRGASLKLRDILAKLNQTDNAVTHTYRTNYASADIIKAKSVLERLLKATNKSEVSYTEEVVTEIGE